MAISWTITAHAYTNTPLASLSLSRLRRSLLNQGKDRCTFVQDGAPLTGASASFTGSALFAHGETVTIKRAGVNWFVGRVVMISRSGAASHETLTYELAGPWWYLENLVFQQNWKIPVTPTDPASALTDEKRSSLVLNLKEDGTTLTTRQQIKEAVDYAIAAGGPIAIDDSTFPALTVTWEEGKDMTCAEVIRRQLRWAPDACLWWDYSTATPTLKCARRAGAMAVSMALIRSDATWLQPAIVATQANINVGSPGATIDGVSMSAGDRVLVRAQSAASGNGVYEWNGAAVPMTRAADADTGSELNVAAIAVQAGTDVGKRWVQTSAVVTVGADSVLWAEVKVEAVDIIERPDLQVPVVALKFEKVNQQDDESWTQTTVDKYPVAASDAQFGAVVMTIPLSGGVVNYQRQKVKTRAIDESNVDWWQKHLAWLNDATISGIEISDASKKSSTGAALGVTFVNELLDGAVPSWLEAYATAARVEALLSYTVTSSKGAISVVKNKPVSVAFTATTSRVQSSSEGVFKEYKQTVTWILGEPAPTGLAQSLYDALSVLQYEGSVRLLEQEVSSAVRPGHVLNLTGGVAAWATMGAQIQRVEEDVDQGATIIEVGPAQHLGPQDLLELLRPNRSRQPAFSQPSRTTGAARANSVTNGAVSTPNQQPSAGSGPFNRLLLKDTDINATAEVSINLNDCGGKALSIREIDVCDGGTAKKMRVLASALYT